VCTYVVDGLGDRAELAEQDHTHRIPRHWSVVTCKGCRGGFTKGHSPNPRLVLHPYHTILHSQHVFSSLSSPLMPEDDLRGNRDLLLLLLCLVKLQKLQNLQL